MTYTIGLDFDGTLVEHCYPKIGPAVPYALEWLRRLQAEGAQFILHTMRDAKELADACEYLQDRGINLFGANRNPTQKAWTDSPKPYCHVYVDDSAIGIPLIPATQSDRRMVDWSVIGPDLLTRLTVYNQTKAHRPGLHVTKKLGSWVFSDLSAGLVDEPFVCGADSLIDLLLEDQIGLLPPEQQAELGVVLEFSDRPFAGHDVFLVRDEVEDGTGNWYTDPATGHRAWLCPALYKYFVNAPANLYAKVTPC